MDPNGRQRRKGLPVHGWVNLDKPYGMGSTKAVGRVRWLHRAAKAGHAGTLDPLATGVLPIALGDATKTVGYMQDAEKSYRFEVSFGAQTSTGDLEGEVVACSDHRPSEDDMRAALAGFVGEIEQVPPRYSAIKIDGKRAYDLARAGVEVEVPSRRVRVDALRLVGLTGDASRVDRATLEVECGKGTYVRSLARDLARAVGTVGHVTVLRRTRVGVFTVESAVTLDALEAELAPPLPVETAVPHLPRAETDASGRREIGFGRGVGSDVVGEDVALFHEGELLALGSGDGERFSPRKVFVRDQVSKLS